MEVQFNSKGLCVCPSCGSIILRQNDEASNMDTDQEAIDCTCSSCCLSLSLVLNKRSLTGDLRQVCTLPACNPSFAKLYARVKPDVLVAIRQPSNIVRELNMSKLRLGMVIEVSRFGWCKAIIANIRTRKKPYTYDIEYDDGEYEERVIRKRIRLLGDRFVTASRQISEDSSIKTANVWSDCSSLSTCSDDEDIIKQNTLQHARQLAAQTNFICEVVDELYKATTLIDTLEQAYEESIIELHGGEDKVIELSSDDEGTATCPILCF